MRCCTLGAVNKAHFSMNASCAQISFSLLVAVDSSVHQLAQASSSTLLADNDANSNVASILAITNSSAVF